MLDILGVDSVRVGLWHYAVWVGFQSEMETRVTGLSRQVSKQVEVCVQVKEQLEELLISGNREDMLGDLSTQMEERLEELVEEKFAALEERLVLLLWLGLATHGNLSGILGLIDVPRQRGSGTIESSL